MMKWTQDTFSNMRQLQEELQNIPGISKHAGRAQLSYVRARLEDFIQDKELLRVTSKLFCDGHHARAVEEAYKFINNLVKLKASVDPTFDGANLMRNVFSPKNPVLKLNAGNSVSEQDEQLGYMEMFAGCITGIRNPRAHEHEWEDNEVRALQLLIFADHLAERVRVSSKVR